MPEKRILFYLEPVVFRNSPLSLMGWRHFFGGFAGSSRPRFESALVASAMIARREAAPFLVSRSEGSTFDHVFEINSCDPLLDVGFDRTAYTRDLCFGEGSLNKNLLTRLAEINSLFDPDIVVAVTSNRYLKQAFPRAAVLFMELGPLPRIGMRLSAFLDPFGHQFGSAMDKVASRRLEHESLPKFLAIWNETWGVKARAEAERSGMQAWLEQVKGDRKVLLAALPAKHSDPAAEHEFCVAPAAPSPL